MVPVGPVNDPNALKKLIDAWIAESQKAIEADSLDFAYGRLVPAMKLSRDAAQKEQIRTLAKSLEAKALGLLAKADADLAEGKFKEAIARYRLLSGMAELKISAQGTAKLAAAEKDPRLIKEVREQRAIGLFAPIHAIIHSVEDKIPDADCVPDDEDVAIDTPLALKLTGFGRVKVLDTIGVLVSKFADTAAGKWAVQVQAKLQENKAYIAAAESDRQEEAARQEYESAALYAKNGQYEKAAASFRTVITKYPSTSFATKARAELRMPEYAPKPQE